MLIQRWNWIKKHFSECISIIKWHMTIFQFSFSLGLFHFGHLFSFFLLSYQCSIILSSLLNLQWVKNLTNVSYALQEEKTSLTALFLSRVSGCVWSVLPESSPWLLTTTQQGRYIILISETRKWRLRMVKWLVSNWQWMDLESGNLMPELTYPLRTLHICCRGAWRMGRPLSSATCPHIFIRPTRGTFSFPVSTSAPPLPLPKAGESHSIEILTSAYPTQADLRSLPFLL